MTWRLEVPAYLRHILALVSPGRTAPQFDAHNMSPASIDSWSDEEKRLLIEEGRRQLDRQATDFNQVQTRAQIVLTTGIALAAGWTATLSGLLSGGARAPGMAWLFLILSALLIVLANLGAASIIVVRAEFGTIHTTLLTHSQPPVLDSLATAYARTVRVGGNTIATRLSVLRYSVLILLAAALLTGAAWVAGRPSRTVAPPACATSSIAPTPGPAPRTSGCCPSGRQVGRAEIGRSLAARLTTRQPDESTPSWEKVS
jgi:hypothetical protein